MQVENSFKTKLKNGKIYLKGDGIKNSFVLISLVLTFFKSLTGMIISHSESMLKMVHEHFRF